MTEKLVLMANKGDLKSGHEVGEEISKKFFDLYYEALYEFLNAVGSYWHLYKLRMNADEGIFPAQVVASEYHHEGAQYEYEIAERETRIWQKMQWLSDIGERVGLKPFNQDGMKKVVNFVNDFDRRRYIRDAAKRAEKKGKLLSAADLMRQRYALEKKRKK